MLLWELSELQCFEKHVLSDQGWVRVKSCYYTILIDVPALSRISHSSWDNGFPWDCEIPSRFFFLNFCLSFFWHVQTTFYLFIFGCVGSSLLAQASSSWGVRVSHCSGFPFAEHKPWSVGFGGCGTWADLPLDVWNLPRPGIKPMSPALAGRFLTTGPSWQSDDFDGDPGGQNLNYNCSQNHWFSALGLWLASQAIFYHLEGKHLRWLSLGKQ